MRILMVCLGNICRSPLAHGILREKSNGGIEVDSAGTSSWHAGEPPDPRTIAVAKKRGVRLSDLRARPFEPADFDRFDKIFVMDRNNLEDVLAMARNEDDRAKVDLLLNQLSPGSDAEVPDPYFGGDRGFEEVFELVEKACDSILKNHKYA